MNGQEKSYDKVYERIVHHIQVTFPVMYLMDWNYYYENTADSNPNKKELKERLETLHDSIMKIPENAQRLIVQNELHEQLEKVAETLGQEKVREFYGDELKKFPEVAESLDKKEIVGAFLKENDLNIYQLRTCLKIAPEYVGKVLGEYPEIKERVKKLLENPKYYMALQSIKDDKTLQKTFKMPKILEQTAENLQGLNGKEVFAVFTTQEQDIPEAREASLQAEILQMYYKQTDGLAKRHDTDLFYSEYKDKKHWARIPDYLQAVGTFKCGPDAAAAVEERIGRILSLYTHKEAYGEPRSNFSYFCKDGMKKFAENMAAEIGQNPDSHAAQFYLKHSQKVLDQYECVDYYIEAAKTLLPKLAESGRFDVCRKLCADWAMSDTLSQDMKEARRLFFNMVTDEWNDNPKSPLSKFFAENITEFSSAADGIIDEASSIVVYGGQKYKPETVELVCEKMCEVYHKHGVENAGHCHNDLVQMYQKHKTPQIAEVLQSVISQVNFETSEIMDCYILWQTTGLKQYEKILDDIIARSKKIELYYSSDAAKAVTDWKPLFEKLQKSDVQELEVRYFPDEVIPYAFKGYKSLKRLKVIEAFSAQDIVPNPKLEVFECQELENPAEAIKQLPNLVEINTQLQPSDPDENALTEYLLANKPEKLETLGISLSGTFALGLMKKYPTFLCDIRSDTTNEDDARKRYRGNELVRRVRDDNDTIYKNLGSIIENNALVECLQMLPAQKRPTLAQLEKTKKDFYTVVAKSYKTDTEAMLHHYCDVIRQIADVLGEKELKQQAELRIFGDEAPEYISALPPEERPKVGIFLEQPKAFAGKRNLETVIRQSVGKDKANMVIMNTIKAMAPTDKELKELAADGNCSESLQKIANAVLKERENKAKTENMKAAFAKWQEEQNKGRK